MLRSLDVVKLLHLGKVSLIKIIGVRPLSRGHVPHAYLKVVTSTF